MKVRRIGAAACAAALFALGGSAGAAPANNETTTEHNGTETFGDYVPCAPASGLDGWEITVTYNSVEHFTENGQGDHFTFTEAGTFSAAPVVFADVNPADGQPDVDPATESFVVAGPRTGESFGGRFTIWGGGNVRPDGVWEFTFTFRGKGAGDAGTPVQWNSVSHVTSQGDPEDPGSLVRVAFDRFRCR
jgi:hypothetical protein